MPYTVADPPRPAKNWTAGEKKKCVKAANAVLRDGGSEQDAIFACIRAAGKTKYPGGKKTMDLLNKILGRGDKAVWTTAYKNDLPDSAFLHIMPGGKKDEGGKTVPRNLRKFPYKDKNGKVDLPHLRNAIARIPQAKGISADTKKSLQAKAQRMLARLTGKKGQKSLAVGMKATSSAFQVFEDTKGEMRWLSWTGCAFKDREKQIVATKALEVYADAAMESGIHGEAWAFGHLPCRFGEPDNHVVINKQLIESGLFDDTPDGQALKSYFQKNSGPYEMSYTFICSKADDDIGVFDWLWIVERSVLPVGTAAHPSVERFNMLAEVKSMNASEQAKADLLDAIGQDRFDEVVKDSAKLAELLEEMGIESKGAAPDSEPVTDVGETPEQDPVMDKLDKMEGQLRLVAESMIEMGTSHEALSERVGGMEAQMKALQEEDDTKILKAVSGLSAMDKARAVAESLGSDYRLRQSSSEGEVGKSPKEALTKHRKGRREKADGLTRAIEAFEAVSGISGGGEHG